MSLGQFLAVLRAGWLRIALMVLVASAVAYVLADSQPRQYTAKARVMLNIDNPDPAQFSMLKFGTEAGYISSEMHLVTEDGVVRDVATKLGWPDNPQVISAWQDATGGVGDITAWAGEQLKRSIQVSQLEDSSIIEIYYSSTSLEAAKQVVALIRTAYINESGRLRAEAARRAAAWNRTQAQRALGELQAAQAEREAYVRANNIALDTPPGGLDYLEHFQALEQAAKNAPLIPSPEDQASVDQLKRRLDAIDADLVVMRLRGDANPATVALEAQRATVAEQYARESAVLAQGANAPDALTGLVRRQRDAEYLKSRLNLLARTPLYDHLASLDRDIALKTRHYQGIASHVAMFDTVAAAPSGLRVVGDVIASDDPTYPNIPLSVGIAAVASFVFAVALMLLGELRSRQVRGTEDLLASTDAPVLAVIAPAPRRRRRLRLPRLGWRIGRRQPEFA